MTAQENGYAIETFGLTKVFPDWWGRAKVVAVEELNLRVRYNEIYGFLGPNGSGKTTTLKMLLNLLYPTRGRALVLGGSTADGMVSRRLGYLPEESYLYKYLSARETLDFYGRLFGLPAQVRRSRIDSLLEMVGLTGMAHRPVGTFSKGMARRIGLAQALINDPDLLILDEPTSGMDPIGTRQIKDLLLLLARRGKTILLCSHLLADVEDVCDRIGILYGGKMQVEGPVRSLLQHGDRRQITTGPLSESALGRIRQIVEAEATQCEVATPMDRLEQFFIRIVTDAQQRKQPTSGAVSTTAIGGFLVEEPADTTHRVLDRLVDKPVGPVAAGAAAVAGVEPTVTQPPAVEDRGLLEKLAHGTASSDAVQTDVTTSVPQPQPTPPAAEVKKDVLESLLGHKPAADGSTEPTRSDKPGDGRNV